MMILEIMILGSDCMIEIKSQGIDKSKLVARESFDDFYEESR